MQAESEMEHRTSMPDSGQFQLVGQNIFFVLVWQHTFDLTVQERTSDS